MKDRTTKEAPAFPASFAQERLWFLQQLQPDSSTFHIPAAVRFKGPLNLSALQSSLNDIVERHEALRTTFRIVEGKLAQVVAESGRVDLEIVDEDEIDTVHGRAELLSRLATIAAEPFDLENGPLLRAVLLKASANLHTLLLVIHHVIADGWSMRVLMRELMEIYQASVNGTAWHLPDLPIQYVDYTHWQKTWLADGGLQAATEYWRKNLTGLPAAIFPTDYPRPLESQHTGARESLRLPEELSAKLVHLGRKEQTTLFMALLAAFKLLWHRYTGEDEIAVGIPVAGRNRTELEPLIGCFLNTLVLRTRISHPASFLQLLKQVRDNTIEAYVHEDVPFEAVLAEISPERGRGAAPLFQVFFNMLNFPDAPELRVPGLEAEILELPDIKAKFDFTLYVNQRDRCVTFDLVYDTALFSAARMSELLRQYRLVLEEIAAAPHQELTSFPLLTSEARSFLPDPAAPLDSQWMGSVHDLFHAQAQSAPDRTAVVDPHVTWTYGQLDALSNRIAGYLVMNGVEKEAIVAVYGHRSAPLVAALLGIMKVGAMFLILDPEYPVARLSEYLRLARPKALLHLEAAGSLPDVISRVLADSSYPVLMLPRGEGGRFENALIQFPTIAPNVPVHADSPAYLTFTSGSTGHPKGVVGKHGSLSHFAPWFMERFSLIESDRFSLLSGLAHDPLHRDVFLALMTGTAIFIPDAEQWRLPGKALAWIRENRISVMNLTPAIGELILSDACEPVDVLDSLRYVFFVGDALTQQHVAAFQKLAPGVTCVNLYGATETQQALSFFAVPPQSAGNADSSDGCREIVPVGRGIKDVQLLVLNKAHQLCGIGEAGEIYFRSPHLALGYLDDPQLSEERFSRSWFIQADGGDRLYRTGDLGRYLPGGGVQLLGRADQQVKIRGFRVELGEIEAVLKRHANVHSVAVVAPKDEKGSRRIAAYVVLQEEGADWKSELYRFTAETLPSYMAPGAFVSMKALPMLPNGKVNRQALLVLDIPDDGIAPRLKAQSDDEEILCGIFADVLKRKQFGRDENFFEAGGHSLMVVQVLSRIRNVFSVELPLRTVFDSPTAAELAQQLRERRRAGKSSPSIRKTERDEALPLSYAQQRLWFLDQLTPGSTAYNMLFGVRLDGALDRQALQKAFNETVQRHEVLRTTFYERNGVPVQKIAPAIDLKIEEVDLLGLAGPEQELQVLRERQSEAAKPFDLQKGPLLRMKLIRISDEFHIVLMTMHHIAGDAWSTIILTREIARLYQAYHSGHPASLAPLNIQYADYAVWQREWLKGEVLEEMLGYWRVQLKGIETLELPLDRERPPIVSQKGDTISVSFDAELTEQLKELSRREGVTLFMVLLAGWQTLLALYSGQQDIAVGVPVAGRSREEIYELVGFFVNTLVLRTRVSSKLSFRELLKRVRERTLEAYDHQDVPFEKLVEELQPKRDLSRQPFFQVMFGLQNVMQEELQMPELRFRALEIEGDLRSAKFDLTLLVAEAGEQIQGRLEYALDLFNRATVETVIRRWQLVLRQMAANVTETVTEISLLDASEREMLLKGWIGPAIENARPETIGILVARHANHLSKSAAVIAEGQELSYETLNRRANQWAHYLLQQGVHRGMHVGVCLESATDLVVASLAVLKAGGVLVGLDPEEPQLRMTRMLKSSAATLLITTRHLAEGPSFEPVRLLYMDEMSAEVARNSDQEPAVEIHAESAACLLYRSGAHGGPAGVLVGQRALCAPISMRDAGSAGTREFDRVALTVNFSEETTILEVFRILASGACVVHLPKHPPIAPRKLAGVLRDQKVTTWWTSAALLEKVSSEFPAALKTVKQIVCHEPPDVLARLCETLNATVLEKSCGAYGWSETNGACLISPLASNFRPEVVSLDQLRPGTKMCLLDSKMRPVPEGVIGEIYVGGAFIALSCDAEASTNADIVADPYSDQPGARMYRTGDRAWRRADGSIELRSRQDGRAVIDGVRIEAEEVEAALLEHDEVGEAVAVMREAHGRNEAGLVAWVVAREQQTLVAKEVQRFLQAKLPKAMIPKSILQVESIARDADGKVDRKALQQDLVTAESAEQAVEYTKPRNAMEEQLADIWAQSLAVEKVGVHDNFFRLGGHSLLATQVVARVSDALHVEVPLRSLFEAPTIAEMARVLEQKITTGVMERALPIKRADYDQALPLSFSQQRLWFLDQLNPGSATYNLHVGIRLIGELDTEALHWSLTEIAKRHGVLRTTFALWNGIPVQLISPVPKLSVDEIDLTIQDEESGEAEARRRAREEAATPFDLSNGPLLRVKLLRLARQENILLVTMHHIISDGWSMGILVREFSQLYAARVMGHGVPLAELPYQYVDYAVWQREWLQGKVLERQTNYWRQQLADVPLLELPIDRPRPALMSQRGASVKVRLNAELTAGLKAISQRENVTLFMTLLAGFQLLLSRYSAQDDFAVGTPIAGRTRTETNDLIGFFINTLVLRTRIHKDASLSQFLGQVRERTLEAYEHQDLPFERLVEELQPERDLSRQPFFQVVFALQNLVSPKSQPKELNLPGIQQVEIQEGEIPGSKFDLLLQVEENERGIEGSLQYTVDLFDQVSVERMVGRWQLVLEQMVQDAEKLLGQISILSEAERRVLASGWNGPICKEPSENIGALVAHQAMLRPQAAAIIADGRELTFYDLNRQANQWAHYLVKCGMRIGTRIGVCLTQVTELMTASLGVLKAGGILLGFDANEPSVRLATMMENSDASLVITEKLLAEFLEQSAAALLFVDEHRTELANENGEEPHTKLELNSPACILYRSGNKGYPVGVLLTQQVLRASVFESGLDLCESDRIAQPVGFSAELDFLQGLQTLARGACIVNIPRVVEMAPRKFASFLREQKVTVLHASAAVIERMLEFPWALAKVRQVLCDDGIEVLQRLRQKLTPELQAKVHGFFGSTENGDQRLVFPLLGLSEAELNTVIPVAHLSADTRLYLLDPCLEPAPEGAVGEIYIAGSALADGYDLQPEETANLFIPDPYSSVPGSRMYCSGEVARLLANGRLELRGHRDGRIVIAGMRVEMAEIENVIAWHPGLRDAAVMVCKAQENDEAALTAVVVPAADSVSLDALQLFLQDKLPECMWPRKLTLLDAIPRNAQGRVDRKRLARRLETGYGGSAQTPDYEPRNEIEERIARIWAEVLQVEAVGMEDNFFRLGGHSLLLIQMEWRIQEALGVELPINRLFESPTVRGIARIIEQSTAKAMTA